MAVGDQLAFKVSGSSLSMHRQASGGSWVQTVAATDAAISGPGRFGLEFYNAIGGKADDWTLTPDLPGSAAPVTAPVNSSVPTISGVAQVGQLLTGTVGSWTGTGPFSYVEQWQRCNGPCNAIAGANALTYTPVAGDVGFVLRLQVTASNSAGPGAPANSAVTASVISGSVAAPVNSGLPAISGIAQVGQLLTGTVGSWTGTGPISYAQEWQRCNGPCNTIAGANALTYTPVAADIGYALRLQVTASNSGGPGAPANSNITTSVSPAPIGAPVNSSLPAISGIAQVGQLLTGTVGGWTGTGPISYAQEWQRCSGSCSTIPGANTLSYAPVAGDVGFTLRLQVTASNSAGPGAPANSVVTAPVSPAAAGGAAVTDSFNRPDALTLGPGWSSAARAGGAGCMLSISANQAAFPAGGYVCEQYWTGDAPQADGVGSFSLTALPPDGAEMSIQGRLQAVGTTSVALYLGVWHRNTTGPDRYHIYRRSTSGVWTELASADGPNMGVGDQLAFRVAGSSLSMHRKAAGGSWVQTVAATDTTINGPGWFGLEFYNATGGKGDDWTLTPDLPDGTPAPAPGPVEPPANSGVPAVSGIAQVGQLLTGTVGSWTGTRTDQLLRAVAALQRSLQCDCRSERAYVHAGCSRRRFCPPAPGHRLQQRGPERSRQLGRDRFGQPGFRRGPGQFQSAGDFRYRAGGAAVNRDGG